MKFDTSFFFSTLLFSIIIYFIIFFKRKIIAIYFGINDIPDFIRKKHKKPVPKTAALSLSVTFGFSLIISLIFDFFDIDIKIILFSILVLFLIGLADDKINLSPYIKLFLISSLVITSLKISNNLIVERVYFESFNKFIFFKDFSLFFTVLCVLLLINSLNLADGINGLALGIVLSWLTHILISFNFEFNSIVCVVFLITIISFYHNYHEKHFLGDSGSILLSAFCSYLIINYSNNLIKLKLPPLSGEKIFILFMLPGIDMFRLFLERILKKKNPLLGDRNHIHHYLLKRNSLKKSLAIYLLALNIPIILTWYLNINTTYVIISSVFLYILSLYFLKKI